MKRGLRHLVELENKQLFTESGREIQALESLEASEYTANEQVPFLPRIKEDYSWLKESGGDEAAFVLVNENRRTIQPGE